MDTTKEKLLEARALIDSAIEDIEKLEEIEIPPIPEPEPEPEVPSGRWLDALNDLEHTNPTGAWGLKPGGRSKSQGEVNYNMKRLTPEYISHLSEIGKKYGIPAAVLCAISCRESNHGYSLDSNGEGDNGNGFGCMQVDKRYHDVQGRPDPYSAEHLNQATGILMDYLAQVEKNHPTWPDKYILKGGVVAYNSGVSNVQTVKGMDKGTTGNDYGADTTARAQMYLAKGIA